MLTFKNSGDVILTEEGQSKIVRISDYQAIPMKTFYIGARVKLLQDTDEMKAGTMVTVVDRFRKGDNIAYLIHDYKGHTRDINHESVVNHHQLEGSQMTTIYRLDNRKV